MKNLSRRHFLGQASCGAIGCSTLLSSLVNLKAINAASMDASESDDDYKALVCIFQAGGNDSFNMLMPRSGVPYQEYARTRSNLAIESEAMLSIDPIGGDGRDFGIHPAMGAVQQLFDAQKLSFISNVGTLIRPVNKGEVYDSRNVPLGLYSHSDQIQQWQTGLPHERSAIGWGGKVADLIRDMNSNDKISMNVSLSGTNVFQTGNETVEFTINPYGGSIGIDGYEKENMYDVFNIERTVAIDNMIDREYDDMFKQTYVDVIRKSRDGDLEFKAALEGATAINTEFSDNYISQSFRMIARTISARAALGMKRQIFFVTFGGWDHHDEILENQFGMLSVLSNALGEFQQSLQELRVEDCVTTFSISEFGRTLTSNGNGTDHAWGGNVMVMGGPVNGGRIFGDYPSIALDTSLELGDGTLIPTLSTDQYFAELALWFGISPNELRTLFPNIGNFYQPGDARLPIGFLNL
ncbi:MAG: DUF1501 domain-containing protein [Saprospiraceae bacterium]|nr:DUF1501 domain-containing protein [Saprospiraceae bacterium]